MIRVECTVKVRKDDYRPRKKDSPKEVIVSSHCNYDQRVELSIGDQRVEVLGEELIAAVRNAMNTKRF